MKKLNLTLLIGSLICFQLTYAQQSLNGRQIMETYQERSKIDFLTSQINYINHSKKGRIQNRSLNQFIMRDKSTIDCYAFLLQFESPKDIKGTSTLTIQNEKKADQQWLYLPAMRMTKRISPNKKTGRFMGTELTYEDLNNYLSEPLEKYGYERKPDQEINGRQCFVVQAIATDDSEMKNSGYSSREIWIDQENFTVLKTIFFDKSGELLKTYHAEDVRALAGTGHFRPYRIEIRNHQTGNWTEIYYADIQIDKPLDQNIFTLNYLQSK
ncbi:MAG: outer membrane lipoprotein-sorting protein [Flavobacteriaceae bacterium]|nr:outer membrane lipoprotein-sorting protein [Flavobacteriaceae bacterium]NNK70518.1 outer membrane lipoprotein-sorting protein [Flavobacteriaceae bacterium]NNL79607.1 outer membrane lipoprotein-sorting protein [Flavobacteriaceae bacterium]